MASILAQFYSNSDSSINPDSIILKIKDVKPFNGLSKKERNVLLKIFDNVELICSKMKDIILEQIVIQSQVLQSSGLGLPFVPMTLMKKKNLKY